MKMFKRFAAALLVGVMALAMLTACVDSTSKIGKEFEDKFVAVLNAARGEGVEALRNDDDLRTKALGQLYYVKDNGTIAEKNASDVIVLEKDKSGNPTKVVLVTVLPEDENAVDGMYKVKEVTAEALGEINSMWNDPDDQEAVKAIQKIGVATRVINGKTYAAVAAEIPASALE